MIEHDDELVANDVRLVGRLTGEPTLVELPSGDALVTFRISVPRSSPSPARTSGAGEGARSAGRLGAVHRVDPAPEAQHPDLARR